MNIASLVDIKPNPNIPDITSGDTVRVRTKIVEGDKERTQVFQGVIIRVRHRGPGSSFTVRRVAYGVGVERTFPIYSPRVEKVEIVRRGKKRRAKLYYLRGLSAKTSRLKERRMSQQELERERERLQKLEQAQEQEPELEQELEEAPELEQEQETELAQEEEEAPKLEQEQEAPELEQEKELKLEQDEQQD